MGKKKLISNILIAISRNEVFCILLLMYMIILILGTLAQKNFGLQFAQDTYFTSNLIWINNIVPFAGGKLILLFIFISLSLRIFMDKWKKKKIGILLLHFGVLILLVGAFICEKYSSEGYIIIKEGEHSNLFIHKNLYELIFIDKINNNVTKMDLNKNILNKNYITNDVCLQIKSVDNNCDLFQKNIFLKKNESSKINRFFNILSLPMFVEQENNRLAINGNIFIKDKCFNFSVLENLDNSSGPVFDNDRFSIFIFKKKDILPFDIHLLQFTRKTYPGVNMAKSYESKISISTQNNLTWRYNIEMNKPFRFMGYTFYQSSFIENDFSKTTILSVVKNIGSIFPYISIFTIFIGFVIHLCFSIKRLFRY